jgi:hypothetical protein
MTMTRPVRIGNAQAFWGDRTDAAAEMLAREPELGYITLDYLAEVSMSILALQRERDPAAGFARDFVDVVRSLAPYWSSGGRCRLITNAGGLNPWGCADACRAALEEAGCRALRIGIVTGDDVLEVVRDAAVDSSSPRFQNLDTGATIQNVRDLLVTANAYLGATPIAEALAQGADIVITGRVADPSMTVAACIHCFGWNDDDFHRLAGATVAGHLIECGTQVTGGISTDWLEVPRRASIGFPIVEVADDGSCIVTKPRGTGGCVTELTVKEQLVYEIGDPERYLSPDVEVSFRSLSVEDLGDDRVRVSGAVGEQCPETYKVSATYRDGFRSAGTLTIIGRDAVKKARLCGELVLERVQHAGFELRDSIVECLGSGDGAGGVVAAEAGSSGAFGEIVLRVAVESHSQAAVERFAQELMQLITAGPQGTTGYAQGRPRVQPVFRYWPCLIARDSVIPHVEVLSTTHSGPVQPPPAVPEISINNRATQTVPGSEHPTSSIQHAASNIQRPSHLYDIAAARSGDKGSSVNIGVIARGADWWEFLHTWLTADRVSKYFSAVKMDGVERFELPNLGALNFVLYGSLRQSLRTDAQGKAFGQILLEMSLPAAVNVPETGQVRSVDANQCE